LCIEKDTFLSVLFITIMTVLYDYIFSNAYQQDADNTEKELRRKYPLLLQEKEHVELAFRDAGGCGRDKEYFTTHRIIIQDNKGLLMTNKRKNFRSIPYSSIQAFAVDTAGMFDGDVSLRIWSKGMPLVQIDFASANVKIYQIQQFMNSKVVFAQTRGVDEPVEAAPPK